MDAFIYEHLLSQSLIPQHVFKELQDVGAFPAFASLRCVAFTFIVITWVRWYVGSSSYSQEEQVEEVSPLDHRLVEALLCKGKPSVRSFDVNSNVI